METGAKTDIITVTIDSNEQTSPRSKALCSAIDDDSRFTFAGFEQQAVDVCFARGDTQTRFWVELKEPEDYLASVINGHLFDQVLRIRETGDPGMILVIGSDNQVVYAVISSCTHRGRRGPQSSEKIRTYNNLIRDFEANAYALRIPVMRMHRSPYSRLLSIAHKVLTDADLLAHRPHPAENERHVAALCMLVPGIGPERAKAILKTYSFRELASASEDDLRRVAGIGPKLAERIVKSMR